MHNRKYWRDLDRLRVQGTPHDKRVKYTPEDKENIKRLYFVDHQGIREITRLMGCSRRLVQFTLFPERLQQARINRDWTKYHNRAELTKSVYELRHRKIKLIKQGLLINKPK